MVFRKGLLAACVLAAGATAVAACDSTGPRQNFGSPGTGTPGDPGIPTAFSPTGSLKSQATGRGLPVPGERGGEGGIGTGAQPGVGGSDPSGA